MRVFGRRGLIVKFGGEREEECAVTVSYEKWNGEEGL